MTRLGIIRAAIVVAILAVLGLGSAQESGFRAAYINSQYLLSLHAVYPQLLSFQEQARRDVNDLNARANDLFGKQQSGVELTPEESELLSVTLSTLQSLTARFEAEIQALVKPALDDITRLVAEVAAELSLSMVFDYSVASESGLIVYALPDTDITELVAVRLTGSQ